MALHSASLVLLKESATSLPTFTLSVVPVDDTRRPGQEAIEATRVEGLLDLEDVHTAYGQLRARFNLPDLSLAMLIETVQTCLDANTPKILSDGTWSGRVTLV
jgi:hypothetical protein